MRKEKLWKSMLAVLTCATFMLSGPLAYATEPQVSAQEENESEFEIENGVLVKYNGNSSYVSVPEGVTSIGKAAFFQHESVSQVSQISLPESVTSIGDGAFLVCQNLEKISWSGNITSIGNDAFRGCGLRIVKLPGNVTSIGDGAFAYCPLTRIEVPESVTSIGENAFENCQDMTIYCKEGSYAHQYAIENELKSEFIEPPTEEPPTEEPPTHESEFEIENGVLVKYNGNSSYVSVPEGVTSIGDMAFKGCRSLTEIQLPEGVTSIGDMAFEYCASLTKIQLPEGVTSIGYSAFDACVNLTEIQLPDSVISIGDMAFNLCATNVDSFTIYCNEGSYAHQYAIQNNIEYELIGGSSETPIETPKHEITLAPENTTITSSDMQELVDINQTQDVVVNSTDGVKFTFPKGTMNMVEGKESYDFGVELTTDYSQVTNSPFTEDEFAFRLIYNYEGKLPSERTSISIPVDRKWIGQRLYYYKISDNGEYTYLTSAVVDNNGIYTITQSHCSNYIASLNAPEEQPETSTETQKPSDTEKPAETQKPSDTEKPTETQKPSDKGDIPQTGDIDMSLYIALCIAGLAGVFVVSYKKTAR